MTGAASILAELLADCDTHGIRVLPAGDGGLTIDGPQDALTPDLIGRLKTHKAELLAILRPEALTPSIGPIDATAAWVAALASLEGDPLFPPDVLKGLRVGDARWAADESPGEPLGPDGWPMDSIDPDKLTPCPKCRTLELWQTLAGDWRCQRCDPPTAATRLQELAVLSERLRKRSSRRDGTRQNG